METVELELHKIELKYSHLRTSESRPKARLTASLAEFGQQNPVLVVPAPDKQYVLIDGYGRVSAIESLSKDTVKALVLPIDEATALLLWHSQEQSSTRSALEDGWFLQELIEQHGQSRDELARRLQRSHSWVSRRLSLVTDLPDEAQKLVRRGKICPYAAGKFLVPLARANKSHCITLLTNLGNRKTSSLELESLYRAWRHGNKKTKGNIVKDPRLFLKIDEKITQPAAKKKAGRESSLLRNIEIIAAVCCRAQVNFWKNYENFSEPEEALAKVWNKTLSAFLALESLFNERIPNAEPGRTGNDSPTETGRTGNKADCQTVECIEEQCEKSPHPESCRCSENGAGTISG